ncbi:MAG: hypothetical protein A2018_08025 [Alphaproteobacteria bacterium GWF2_58_20]|nr:MAG: hypothetical protein A2018_08025 [Alphaproteobacteria bacterium GWF2_58_20]
MPKINVRYTVASKEQRDQRRNYYHDVVRKQFASHLATHHAEKLRILGIPEEQITIMRDRGEGPEGYNIHHKIPLHAGGTNDFSNLILMRADLHCHLHRFVDAKILGLKVGKSRDVVLPFLEGEVCFMQPWKQPGWNPNAPLPVPPSSCWG